MWRKSGKREKRKRGESDAHYHRHAEERKLHEGTFTKNEERNVKVKNKICSKKECVHG